MREKLFEISDQFVLGVGWIEGWWDLSDGTRRYCIKNPIIKKPNRDFLFDDLPTITKEDHINFFLPKEDFNEYCVYTKQNAKFERFEKINFSGIVKGYTRKDGSSDFGIHPTKFSNFHFCLQDLQEEIDEFFKNLDIRTDYISKKSLLLLEYQFKPRIYFNLQQLDECGDQLPTFVNTHNHYLNVLEDHMEGIQNHIKMIRSHTSSRKFRRICKIKNNFSKDIKPFEELYPNHIFPKP